MVTVGLVWVNFCPALWVNYTPAVTLAKPFLDKWEILKTVDIVLPVPASKERDYQPAVEIAKSIAAYLNVSYTD
jgi:predicted amidophosphoribosyltransferase